MVIERWRVAVGRCGSNLLAAVLTLVVAGVAAASPGLRNNLGQPDLEGVWSYNSITTLERPPELKALVLTDAEARAYESAHPGTPEPARAGSVGQDATEWWEMGGKLGRLAGKARSSWIVEPQDGRLPYSEGGLAVLAKARALAGNFDGPEVRPAPERCLMGIGGSSLPPMINAGYGALLRIVQTKTHVVLLTEMGDGPRIIPLTPQPHAPGPAWSGYSQGHWEGDALVVETTSFHPSGQWRAPSRLLISTGGKVTERFRRVGPNQIEYSFTVNDPAVFTRAWRGEMPLNRTGERMFEFACHEGNYSLPGILAGGREDDRAASPRSHAP